MKSSFFSGFGKLVFFAMLLIGGVFAVGACAFIGYNNQSVSLQNQFGAQEGVVASAYDKMWKKIAQQAQVTDAAKEGFKEVYHGMMEARYDGQNPAFLWLQEHNPNFDLAMFRQLMNTIDGEREGFHREQQRLLDIKMQHDNLRQQFPSSFVCGAHQELKVQLITSSRTEEAVRTGRDDDIDVFGPNN